VLLFAHGQMLITAYRHPKAYHDIKKKLKYQTSTRWLK
jgi:hypothetical protein